MSDNERATGYDRDGTNRRLRARPACAEDAEAMGAMFARAFADDPVWVWMCKNRVRHFTRLAAPFFTTETRQYVPGASAWTVSGANAGALWAPPGAWRPSVADLVRWAPSALRLFGMNLIRSLSALAVVEKVHPREPHWYLALLGTDPDHQGTGLGSAVLRPVLDRCDEEAIGAYLESSKEANLSFYARHGFEVTGQVTMGRGPSGPPMWTMWREPQVPLH